MAAILFTSGSTGPAKGVYYTHGVFNAQLKLVREAYAIEPGEVDFPMLPIFALFNPALGATTVVPRMNPSRPARAEPAALVQAIEGCGVTTSFGSPVLWLNICRHCAREGLQLRALKRVLVAGAPVPPQLVSLFRQIAPNATLHTPYGATEVLPVSSITAEEILSKTAALTQAGHGLCVGKALQGNTVRIIEVTQENLPRLEGARALPQGQVGEVIVSGPTVTPSYHRCPEATAAAKIEDDSGALWHRMGDLGYLDDKGRLWFCGRVAERVLGDAPAMAMDLLPTLAELCGGHLVGRVRFSEDGGTGGQLLQPPGIAQQVGHSAGDLRRAVHGDGGAGLREALSDADAVMLLRVQKERQTAGLFPSLGEYTTLFGLTVSPPGLVRIRSEAAMKLTIWCT